MINQVLSIEQMQELKELGIDTIHNASCEWVHTPTYGWTFAQFGKGLGSDKEYVEAFSLEDILKLIPKQIEIEVEDYFSPYGVSHWEYYLNSNLENNFYYLKRGMFSDDVNVLINIKSTNLLQAAFNMLKYLKKNNYI